jgi:hypothetical protein
VAVGQKVVLDDAAIAVPLMIADLRGVEGLENHLYRR